jgi:hypothetical protein
MFYVMVLRGAERKYQPEVAGSIPAAINVFGLNFDGITT